MDDLKIIYTGRRMSEILEDNINALKAMPRITAVLMVNEFKENIATRGGMMENGSIRPFRGRAFHLSRTQGKKSNYDTGKMMNSIHIISVSSKSAIVGIDHPDIEPYANVMQNGATIIVSKKMKKMFWAKYYQASGGIAHTKKGALAKTSKNSRLSNDAAIYKAMALKKVGSVIKIEPRTFMKITTDLDKMLMREIIFQFDKVNK